MNFIKCECCNRFRVHDIKRNEHVGGYVKVCLTCKRVSYAGRTLYEVKLILRRTNDGKYPKKACKVELGKVDTIAARCLREGNSGRLYKP